MEFVGRAVAVATADKKLRGNVAKVEEGRLHVTLRSGQTAVVGADEIVDLQVLSEAAEQPRASSHSPSPAKQPRSRTRAKRSTPKAESAAAKTGSPAPRGQAPQGQAPQGQAPPAARKPPAARAGAGAGAQAWDAARGEFDFEASHRQFDKAAVFQSIKETAPPAANGQRSVFRPDEMVIPSAPHGSRIAAAASSAPAASAASSQAASQAALPSATALQKVQVQSYMLGQGWSAAAVDETAGRGVAGACLRELQQRGAATAVVLAGNHASGARALAAGRVLATRGVFVVAVLVDAAPAQLEAQMPAFKAAGGAIVSTQKALFAALERAGRVALVVDALQGLERTSLEDQMSGPEQLAASRWLVGWANSQAAARIALERPSTHGDLALQATAVASGGWPLAEPGLGRAQPPLQYVIDLGVPQQVLQKLSLPQLYINFGDKLYIEVRG